MKKILIISITIFLFGIQKIISQNYLKYYEEINKAEIANLDKNFERSDSIYKIAFQLVEKPFKEDYFLAAINSEKLNDNQKTYSYLKKGIQNGLILKRIKKELSSFKKSKEWKILKKEYDVIRHKHLKTLNLELREEIMIMFEKDQKARKPVFGSSNKMKETDSYNYKRLLEIIKENGNKWPGFSLIGETTPTGKYKPYGNIAYMLLHFNKEQVKVLKPYMLEAVLNGEMYPYHFARIIDYKNILDCQIYGTYIYNKKYDVGEICDCDKANEERKKIGFEPLKDFYRKLEVEYKCRAKK